MAQYGMTNSGFIPKRAEQCLNDLTGKIQAIQNPETGEFPFINETDDSLVMQIVGIFADELGVCWSAAQQAAVQFDPLHNYGAGMSGTVQLNGIIRDPGSYSILKMQLSGSSNTVIPVGSVIANDDASKSVATIEDAVIGPTGIVAVNARATEKGPYNPEPGEVFNIQTQINNGNWSSATNLETLSVGSYEEEDAVLRQRQQRSTSLTSYRQIDAIQAAALNVPGVTYARAYQNSETFPADSRGIPFKEVALVAVGGESTAICDELFLRLPTGQIGYGNTTETIQDKQGLSYPISFSRPEEVPIYVSIDISITNPAEYPGNAAELIQQAIIEYAQYGGSGNQYGFPPGESVIRSRLCTPINSVAGHKINNILIGTESNNLGENDIAIGWNQVSIWTAENIVITVS